MYITSKSCALKPSCSYTVLLSAADLTFKEFLRSKVLIRPINDFRIVSQDERVQRYERAVVMAVKSLSYVFMKLSDEFLEKKVDDYGQLFSDKKFWKLAKHQNPGVRTS